MITTALNTRPSIYIFIHINTRNAQKGRVDSGYVMGDHMYRMVHAWPARSLPELSACPARRDRAREGPTTFAATSPAVSVEMPTATLGCRRRGAILNTCHWRLPRPTCPQSSLLFPFSALPLNSTYFYWFALFIASLQCHICCSHLLTVVTFIYNQRQLHVIWTWIVWWMNLIYYAWKKRKFILLNLPVYTI